MRLICLLIGLTIMQLTCCSSGPALPKLPADAVILAFGDSLTYGTGAMPGESYPAVLSKLIGRRVLNSGVPGEVTAEGLARLEAVLETQKPALIILCHGGNDLLRQMDRQQAAENLRAMIRMARDRGIAVMLVAVPALGLTLSPLPFYAEVAREFNIPCEEKALAAILAKNTYKSDYIHPNAAGYRQLAEALARQLKQSGAI